MKKFIIITPVILLLLFNSYLMGQSPSTIPLHVEIPIAPMPYVKNGKTYLMYELHVTNFRSIPLSLVKLEVLDDGLIINQLADYNADLLKGQITNPGVVKKREDRTTLGPGERGIIYLEIPLPQGKPLPNYLRHRLHVLNSRNAVTSYVESSNLKIDLKTPPIITAPLRGDGWVSFNGIGNSNEHRRSIIVLDGRGRIGQRFAIDWVKLGPDGAAFKQNLSKNENFYGYGQDLYAVADGVVSDIHDGIPDNDMSSEKKAVRITIDTIGGNYVILDIGGGYYAFYGHLIPGSLRVKKGDIVKLGDVIGKLGNSGNSDGPHLHFHIADGNSPLGAEGMPYLIDSFEVKGSIANIDELFEGKSWKPLKGSFRGIRTFEMPDENSVYRFPVN